MTIPPEVGTVGREKFLQLVVNGVEGSEVIKCMKRRDGSEYKTSSLISEVSRIKKMVMEGDHRNPDFDRESLSLRKFAEKEADVASFFELGLVEQESIQRKRKTNNWSGPARYALSQLQILPVNMNTFKVDEDTSNRAKDQSRLGLERKVALLIRIDNTRELLHELWNLLDVTVNDTIPRIVLPLLLATGRRTVEIFRPESSFEAVEDHLYAWFTGQAKKPEGASLPYKIPLLSPFDRVSHAFKILREKLQAFDDRSIRRSAMAKKKPSMEKKKPVKRLSDMSNDEINLKYQTGLREGMKCVGERP